MDIATIDIETTGLDFVENDILEVGVIRKDWGSPVTNSMLHQFYYNASKPPVISDFINKLTGITLEHVKRNGFDPTHQLKVLDESLAGADYILAQNGRGFDKPFLLEKYKQFGFDITSLNISNILWIDSQDDINWEFKSTHLNYLAAELGFLNYYPHGAITDSMVCRMVVERACERGITTIEEIIKNASTPWVYLKAEVSFDDNKLAKERGYRWNRFNNFKAHKTWIGRVKEDKLDIEISSAPFDITVLERCDT